MRNRAKCKLCLDVIESRFESDYAKCECGEIAIEGGKTSYKVYAKDLSNIIRVDDEGNEIIPVIKDNIEGAADARKPNLQVQHTSHKPTYQELLEMLDHMIKNIEELPPMGLQTYITHYDFLSAMLLFSSLFRSACKEDN